MPLKLSALLAPSEVIDRDLSNAELGLCPVCAGQGCLAVTGPLLVVS
jgi:hypothetical protein